MYMITARLRVVVLGVPLGFTIPPDDRAGGSRGQYRNKGARPMAADPRIQGRVPQSVGPSGKQRPVCKQASGAAVATPVKIVGRRERAGVTSRTRSLFCVSAGTAVFPELPRCAGTHGRARPLGGPFARVALGPAICADPQPADSPRGAPSQSGLAHR